MLEQFRRTWKMLRDIDHMTSEEEWRQGSDGFLIPSRLAYHIVFTADLYSTHLSYEEYRQDRNYKVDWEAATADELPSLEETLAYIDQTETRVEDWLRGLGDEGLMEPEEKYGWTGDRVLGRALYLLRHNQHHIGEINAELRHRGLERGKW